MLGSEREKKTQQDGWQWIEQDVMRLVCQSCAVSQDQMPASLKVSPCTEVTPQYKHCVRESFGDQFQSICNSYKCYDLLE